MRVMFLCGYLYEGIGTYFGRQEENMGGWIKGFANGISSFEDIELYYAVFEQSEQDHVETKIIGGKTFFIVSYASGDVIRNFLDSHPCDVYHLFGVESEHTKALLPFLDFKRTLVYIQGIISESIPFYTADYDRYHHVSPVFRAYMRLNLQLFAQRADAEKMVFQSAEYVAGRTDWDAAYISNLKKPVTYFHLNESLRDGFYTAGKWSSETMVKHTIFVTQASYPLKGAHMIVEIIRLLKETWPDVVCRIGGENLMKASSPATKLGVSYASYIQKMINEYGLENHIQFLGNLSEQEVICEMQKANIFLLASSVENSPNSLMEAMYIGTPCVSSFVGGVPSLVTSQEQCQLYPFSDVSQAAYKISRIFKDPEFAENLSEKGKERAQVLTDRTENARTLHQIYTIINNNNL